MSLKPVSFLDVDFSRDLQNSQSGYRQATIDSETTAGVTLLPGDIGYDFLIALAASQTHVQNRVNLAANRMFLCFAQRSEEFDLWGESHGLPRLGEQKARCLVEFIFTEPLVNSKTIFANTEVTDGTLNFYTIEEKLVNAGETSVIIEVEAEEAGPSYNGVAAGEIDTLSTAITFVSEVVNLTESSGGGNSEDNERYKIRLQLVPSAPGSRDGLKKIAMTTNTEIVDLQVLGANDGASPGFADVYILKRDISNYLNHNSTFYATAITEVNAAINTTKTRGVNTTYRVYAPDALPFTLTVSLKIFENRETVNLISRVQTVIQEWSEELRNKLGAYIYEDLLQRRIEQLEEIVQATVTISWTVSSPSDPNSLAKNQVAVLTAIPTPTIDEYIPEV